ncbi:hypothetical protein SEA_ORCANUS_54 [Arthrobacter phage Orcanus]|nr:hypothetical protein SEA_ORCANUS_54 [Arthrobacter phage Orcanus]
MARIKEHTEFSTHCSGCGCEYGERVGTLGEAELFVKEFPLCSDCGPED